MSTRHIAGDDEALAHLGDGRFFAVVKLLEAVTERLVRALEVANQLAQANRLQRERVIGALAGTVQREVLLDDSRAEHVGSHGHGNVG